MSTPHLHDCAVVGGGPAGLAAALYLQRFHRDVVLLDAGASRARWIPESNNCPGFPQGISGDDLLRSYRDQVHQLGMRIVDARIGSLARCAVADGAAGGAERPRDEGDGHGPCFLLRADDGRTWRARRVLLATGVVDVLPDVPWTDEAMDATALRLCAICDGYEASDGRLAVYGAPGTALSHARFLRTFSADVAVLFDGDATIDDAYRAEAAALGVTLLGTPSALDFDGERCGAVVGGTHHAFDALYPAMGSDVQSALATGIGARVDDTGALHVDDDKMTSVEGLYAIGDVVSALNQISVATGHAAIAATAVHNALPPNPRAAR